MPYEEYDHLLNLVRRRRSIRQFKPDPLPEGCVEKIVEVARWAPSGFHTQPWEFVVVKNQEVKEAIVKALDQYAPAIRNTKPGDEGPAVLHPTFRDAPVFIILLVDWRAKIGLPGHPKEKNPRVTDVYQSSLAGAFLYLHLAATSFGLASQWYSAASRPNAESAIRKIIGIPEYLSIYDMMVLGYPAAAPGPKEPRSLDEMIHYDACGPQDFRTDDQVSAYAQKTWEWCMSEH